MKVILCKLGEDLNYPTQVTIGSLEHCMRFYNDFEAKNKDCRVCFNTKTLQCRRDNLGYWYVAEYFDGAHTSKKFSYLKNALKYMEKVDK